MKPSILFILHLPPPIHGAAVVGGIIKNSKTINDTFNTTYINLTTSASLDDIGNTNIRKVGVFLVLIIKIFGHLLSNKTDLCYITLNAKGLGFYKDFLMVLIAKLFRKKILFHFHNKGVKKASQKKINKLLYSICFQNTKTILLSPLLYSDVEEFIDEDNIYYCANGIKDTYEIEGVVESKKNRPCEFLWLSNMMIDKGILTLLDSCRLLKDKGLSFKCRFIGSWSDFTEEMFVKVAKEYDLNGIVFAYGKKYNEEKSAYITNADVFVFPTHNETFGLVLLEAMQSELPVISTVEGGIPNIVDNGKTGFLVQPKNAQQFAEKMELFINNRKLTKDMGKAGRRKFKQNFTISHFEEKLIEILTDVLK